MNIKNKMKRYETIFQKDQIERVMATFRLEGLELTESTLRHCQMLLESQVTIEEAILLAKKGL